MSKKIFIWLLATFLLATVSLAQAQQAKTIPRMGYLTLGSGPTETEVEFKQRLRDLGWVEGQNITIEYRWAAGKVDRLPALAEELVRLKVDVIVASATPVIQAAKNATTTIPIVMLGAADPVGFGSLLVLPDRVATSRGCRYSLPSLPARGWSCSKRPFQNSPAWLFLCGSRTVQAMLPRRTKSNPRLARLESRFSRWR